MKTTWIIFILSVFVTIQGRGQVLPPQQIATGAIIAAPPFIVPSLTTVLNTDTKVQKTMGDINKTMLKRNLKLALINRNLEKVIAAHKEMAERKYTKSKFDKSGSNLAKTVVHTATSLGQQAVAKKLMGFGMTRAKNGYMKELNVSTALMPFLHVNPEQIAPAERQKLYRMRKDILRSYSENNKLMRKQLLYAAAAYGIINQDELIKMLIKLENSYL